MSVAITVHVFVFCNLAIAMGSMSSRVFAASRGIAGKEFLCAAVGLMCPPMGFIATIL